MSITAKLRTWPRLGASNLARVAWYRLQLKLGQHPVQRLTPVAIGDGAVFNGPNRCKAEVPGNPDWSNAGIAFGFDRFPLPNDDAPDWLLNRITNRPYPNPTAQWWRLGDFDSQAGDIKGVWELSRFDWVLALAQQHVSGRPQALDKLNRWLADWWQHNPAYLGPNWKCGQEASIRVLHLLLAAKFTGDIDTPSHELQTWVLNHLQRVVPTMSYAVGQMNNHATTEAAAVYMGGQWLQQHGHAIGAQWHELGRYWLENRALKLIQSDGTFSQYSVNYHRLMLDAYSLALWWQKRCALSPFPSRVTQRLLAAMAWLAAMVDKDNGDVPNLGYNDGANLLPLTAADYRDFRPSLGLAQQLLTGATPYVGVPHVRQQLQWLDMEPTPATRPATTDVQLFDDGGFAVIHRGGQRVVFRYPRRHFRPIHCDALHVDVSHNGVNLLRDAGTFRYNCSPEEEACFRGPAGHNVVHFDNRDPMRSLGPFLYADWPETEDFLAPQETSAEVTMQAAYRNRSGAWHRRRISVSDEKVVVMDDVADFAQQATLRWRLAPADWSCDVVKSGTGHEINLTSSLACLTVRTDSPATVVMTEGWESRYYSQKSPLPVLEVTVHQPGQLVSSVQFGGH